MLSNLSGPHCKVKKKPKEITHLCRQRTGCHWVAVVWRDIRLHLPFVFRTTIDHHRQHGTRSRFRNYLLQFLPVSICAICGLFSNDTENDDNNNNTNKNNNTKTTTTTTSPSRSGRWDWITCHFVFGLECGRCWYYSLWLRSIYLIWSVTSLGLPVRIDFYCWF